MKTLKNIQVRLQSEEAEILFVKSISFIEKTYLTLATAAFILTVINFIKSAI